MRLSRVLWRGSIGLILILLLVCKVSGRTPPRAEILEDLARVDIVYLGENHARREDHEARWALIRGLHAKNPRLAFAFEMFQRPYQIYLDRYLAGTIGEAELREKTEYDTRWGFDWEFYAPVLRFAREKKLPLVALNAPAEITRKVAREGLDNLAPAERLHVPDPEEIELDNAAYREMIREVYRQHPVRESGRFERFFLVQVLWDETMAEAIAEFHRANPTYQILVLAGRGHVVYGYGIPDRVRRRLGERVTERTVLLGEDTVAREPGFPAPADYFWGLEKETPTPAPPTSSPPCEDSKK